MSIANRGAMDNPIRARLAELPDLSKTRLHDMWNELFHHDPPVRLRRDVMISILGYRLQEQASGGISAEARRKLTALARTLEWNPKSDIVGSGSIKPGTRLVREWGNKVHVVDVEERGYKYAGSRYESLSQIARLITGTRWSGPLFFGLRRSQATKSREAA